MKESMMARSFFTILSILMLISLLLVSCDGTAPDAPVSRPDVDYDALYPGKVFNETTSTVYPTLAAALASAVDGDIVVLCRNETVNAPVRISRSIVLDLNGHSIENTDSGEATVYVRSNPTGVFLDNVQIINGRLIGKPSGNALNSVVAVVECRDFKMEDVTVSSNVGSGQAEPAAALYINGVLDAVLNNLSVTGKTVVYQRAANDASVKVTINGGTFRTDPNCTERNVLRLGGDLCSIPGNVTVNGASFYGNLEVYAAYPYPDLIINSGKWDMDVTAYVSYSSTIKRVGDIWIVYVAQ